MRVKKRLLGVFSAFFALVPAVVMSVFFVASTPLMAESRVVAVYVIGDGDVSADIKESVGAGLFDALADSKQYAVVGNSEAFLIEVDALQSIRTDNAVYDSQISEIGAKFGAGFVCVAEITPTLGAFHVLARMIDVKTAEAVSVGNAFNPLKSDADFTVVSTELVKKMAGERVEPSPIKLDAGVAVVPMEPVKKSGGERTEPAPIRSDIGVAVVPAEPVRKSGSERTEPSPAKPTADLESLAEELNTKIVDNERKKREARPLYEEEDGRKSMTGFSFGYGLSLDADSKTDFFWLGLACSVPISKEWFSLNIESDFWYGSGNYTYKQYDGSVYGSVRGSMSFWGVSVPLTVLFQWSVIVVEAGAFGDALFVDDDTYYNAGVVVGAGLVFDKKRARRYFYRYNSGFKYGTHVIGMGWLF